MTYLFLLIQELEQRIPLEGVEGRIDHMAVDVKGQRLFVAALGNNSLEIVDLKAGKRVHSIRDLPEPQGVLYVNDQIVVSCGGDGSVRFFDGLKQARSVQVGEDADNMRTDGKHIYVGYGSGAIGIVDSDSVKLQGHPESFQIGEKRMYVNVPSARHIAVVENREVVATWPVKSAGANYPMALDEANHRLYVGCRKPAKLVVFDTESGKEVGGVDCAGDPDDIFVDAKRKRIYMSCGQGVLQIFEIDTLKSSSVKTAPGARTCLFVPELDRIYVAVPDKAEIQIYKLP
jgi:DNA-binding beta-propeller fold protein YncE